MVRLLKLIANIMNFIHDEIIVFLKSSGIYISDKTMHFIVMAVVGITLFFCVQLLFKWLSKYSITAISFIYTFTVMVVFVFAIEIAQKLTGGGAMEFADITYGLYGFLCAFAIFLITKWMFIGIKYLANRYKTSKTSEDSPEN